MKKIIENVTERRLIIAIVIIGLIVLFGWQSVIELRAEEPRRATVSIEMMLNGEYLVPHLNGWSYYNKPPLFNWLMVGCFRLFKSMDEWVVRFPSLLAAVILAFISYRVSRLYIDRRTAMLSSLFLLTTVDPLFYGLVTSGELDFFFSLIVYLQAISILHFSKLGKFWNLFIVSYLLCAIGFLTKGMPAIAYQGLTLIPYLLIQRNTKKLFSIHHISGIAVFAAIVGLYIYQFESKDDSLLFIARQFNEASQRSPLENQWAKVFASLFKYPLHIFQLLLPWSLFSLFFLRKELRKEAWANPYLKFCLVFIFANITIYVMSASYRARYIYPFIVFFGPTFCFCLFTS